jgi:lysozyme
MVQFDRAILAAELVRDEGERLKVYLCTANRRTIGVGRNLDDVGISAAETEALGITVVSCVRTGITRQQSRALLDNDICRCEADLDRRLAWWRTLDAVRQRVLLNMCFNLGIKSLLGFVNTLAMMKAGQYQDASVNMLKSKWATQVGKRANRLSDMMRKGVS